MKKDKRFAIRTIKIEASDSAVKKDMPKENRNQIEQKMVLSHRIKEKGVRKNVKQETIKFNKKYNLLENNKEDLTD